MELYLQFGHGMMDHSRKLIDQWLGGGVVLSPRDLDDGQLRVMGPRIAKSGAEVLLDPQCFLHDADHHRLVQHEYWAAYKAHSTVNLADGAGAESVLAVLSKLNREIGATRLIVPGMLADPVSEEWFALHDQMVRAGVTLWGREGTLGTVAMSLAAMKSEDQVESVVDRASRWPCQGIYLVCESPSYLVDDPTWMANLLVLVAGLKLAGKELLVGYCQHQMLALAAAGASAMASGTWLNVRSFPPKKFYTPDEDEQSRRAVWYYCPQALSEYKLPFLEIARRQGLLESMLPDPALGSTYADALFKGPSPTAIAWPEKMAFRHYLTCLRSQCVAAAKPTFDETRDSLRSHLALTSSVLKRLRERGVKGQDRDFTDCVDVNDAALLALDSAQGARLRRNW